MLNSHVKDDKGIWKRPLHSGSMQTAAQGSSSVFSPSKSWRFSVIRLEFVLEWVMPLEMFSGHARQIWLKLRCFWLHGHVGLVVSPYSVLTCSKKTQLPKSSCMLISNGFLLFQTISSSTLPNTFIIHARTSSSFTINNERHYPPPTPFQTLSPSTQEHHLGLQSTASVITTPAHSTSRHFHHPHLQALSSSTQERHLRLQSTTNGITPSTKHWRVTSPKCPCHLVFRHAECSLWHRDHGREHALTVTESKRKPFFPLLRREEFVETIISSYAGKTVWIDKPCHTLSQSLQFHFHIL